jgi:class 3 adenylate cyclase/CHASE2 domain-containing sensor protein
MDTGERQTSGRQLAVPALISVLALAVAWLAGIVLEPYEAISSDVLMRMRCSIGGDALRRSRARSDIVLLAIDPESQDRLGRYGQGRWLSREPYFEQLVFFAARYKPTAIGFDIIFQNEEGWVAADGWVEPGAEPADDEIRAAVDRAMREGKPLSLPVIRRLNRLLARQGNMYLGHCLAEVRESFPVIAGYSARGGWLNEQVAEIPPWSDSDVFGSSADGNEEKGERIPFLKDMAIPAGGVRLPPGGFDRRDYMWNANLPARDLLNYAALGFLDGPPDADSVIRRLPMVAGVAYSNRVTGVENRFFVPSLSLAMVITHLGIPFPIPAGTVEIDFGREIRLRPPRGGVYRIPVDGYGRLNLNYDVLFQDFRQHSMARFVGIRDGSDAAKIGEMYRSHFDGSMVFVGVTLTGVDWGACPVDRKTPRVFMHMVAANNILNQDFLAAASGLLKTVIMVSLAVLCALLGGVITGIRVAPAFAVLGAVYAVIAWLCAQTGVVLLPVVVPLLYLALVALSVLAWRYLAGERERKRIRGMFSTMVSQQVLRYLEEHPESFSLRGHSADATVLFTDLTGFTEMSERLPPEKLVAILNSYFTPVTNAVVDAEGYLDKYTGDGIMAVWGAPYPDQRHAAKACSVALRQREIMRAVNAELAAHTGTTLRVRTGINSGPVVAGNMGSGRRLQYTVVGDTVNLAARFEPFNKDFGTDIVIGPATREAAGDRFVTRRLGRLVVFGKQEVVEAYELVGETGAVDDARLKVIAFYEEALDAFQERQWALCISLLEPLLNECDDAPSRFLLHRALRFQSSPPGARWHGEFAREHKQ